MKKMNNDTMSFYISWNNKSSYKNYNMIMFLWCEFTNTWSIDWWLFE